MKPEDIAALAAEVRAARQAWHDAEQALEAAKAAVGQRQQEYFALADQADRMAGPTARRLARQSEIARLEAALKEFSNEDY